MPRRRPGAVRAHRPWPRSSVPGTQVPRVSARTRAAVRRVELERPHLGLGDTALALARYRAFVRQPGRLQAAECPCPGCDLFDSRNLLQEVLEALPQGARVDLERIVTPLDEVFERRTVHDPGLARWSPWAAEYWWRQRSRER